MKVDGRPPRDPFDRAWEHQGEPSVRRHWMLVEVDNPTRLRGVLVAEKEFDADVRRARAFRQLELESKRAQALRCDRQELGEVSARNIRIEAFCVGRDHRLDAEFLSDEPNPGLLNVALEFREPEMKTLIFLAQRRHRERLLGAISGSRAEKPRHGADDLERQVASRIRAGEIEDRGIGENREKSLVAFQSVRRATLRSIAQAMPKKNGVYSSEFSTHSFKINSPPRSTSNEKTPIEGIWFAISAHMSNSGFGTAIDNIYFP